MSSIRGLIEQIFRHDQSQAAAPQTPSNPALPEQNILTSPEEFTPSFDIQPNHQYKLYGAETEDQIPQFCERCGGGYQGILEQSCAYCGTGRQAFLVDVTLTPHAALSFYPQTEAIELPIFSGVSVKYGDNVDARDAYGDEVTIGDRATLVYIIGNTIQCGSVCDADFIVGSTITTGRETIVRDTVLGTTITIGFGSEIETIIVLDNGTLTLNRGSSVGTVILGRNAQLIIRDNTNIGCLRTVGILQRTYGDSVEIEEEDPIILQDYYSKAIEVLKNVTFS